MLESTEESVLATGIEAQRSVFERCFGVESGRWAFHDDPNPVLRYVRDRRLKLALKELHRQLGSRIFEMSLLTVCGGVGGEATFFRKAGFKNITNTDFSENALKVCNHRDPLLQTRWLNAESMDLADGSFDIVLVQDGLHHLPRPVLGLNEMLRVARHGVVVIEPHLGLAAKILGREWEEHNGIFNYVFRWNRMIFQQTARSQLLKLPMTIHAMRLWDHSGLIHRVVSRFGNGRLSFIAARLSYSILKPFNSLGNNFIGIVVKHD